MKKTTLLNSEIFEVISKNIPGFIETLKCILTELQIEEIIVATETFEVSPHVFNEIKKTVGDVKITFVTHEKLKDELHNCKAVVRTGEQTPYANVILKSGVVF